MARAPLTANAAIVLAQAVAVLSSPFRHKRRCHCHKTRKEHGKLILFCDVLLVLLVIFIAFLAIRAFVLPSLRIPVDIHWLVNELGTGYVLVFLAIGLNFVWAIYYGCTKSKAGVALSLTSGLLMLKLYNVF